MHKNVIEGLEAAGCPLQHVYFNAGGKWYGKLLDILIYPHHSSTLHMTLNIVQPLSWLLLKQW